MTRHRHPVRPVAVALLALCLAALSPGSAGAQLPRDPVPHEYNEICTDETEGHGERTPVCVTGLASRVNQYNMICAGDRPTQFCVVGLGRGIEAIVNSPEAVRDGLIAHGVLMLQNAQLTAGGVSSCIVDPTLARVRCKPSEAPPQNDSRVPPAAVEAIPSEPLPPEADELCAPDGGDCVELRLGSRDRDWVNGAVLYVKVVASNPELFGHNAALNVQDWLELALPCVYESVGAEAECVPRNRPAPEPPLEEGLRPSARQPSG